MLVSQRPEFTLRQLSYFLAAAETGSMTAAAQLLCVAQSAISSAVSQLERRLGIQLFIRHHARGLTLTADGDRFLLQARDLLMQASELASSAANLSASPSGRLSVGCFTTLAPFHLPRLLSDLAASYPQLEIDIVEGESERLQEALRNGTCELALMYDLGLDADFDKELLSVAPPYAILAPSHPLAIAGKGASLRDLAREPMVLLDLPHSRDYFRSLIASSGIEPQIRYRTANYETVRSLVAHGHGYALMNQQPSQAVTYDGAEVAAIPLLDKIAPLPIVLTTLPALRQSARARAFAERCRALFRTPRVSAEGRGESYLARRALDQINRCSTT
jgi:DNA-binding transcriptional LysR family regulator